MDVTDRGPLDRFRRQHGINKVGELDRDFAAWDTQPLAVPDCHRRLVIPSNVEGRRRSSQVFGINQAKGEDVGGNSEFARRNPSLLDAEQLGGVVVDRADDLFRRRRPTSDVGVIEVDQLSV